MLYCCFPLGTLDLFSVDGMLCISVHSIAMLALTACVLEQGQPDVIARSLLPKWNSFVFFEVSPVSFHQVN